jgi:hypothetical protein
MAIPLIAAGIAARAVAKKLATRAAGGITGSGAKQVTPVYRNQGFSEAVLKRPSYTPKNSLGKRATTDAIQKNSVKTVKSQAQINAEGAANARTAMGLSPKPTAQEIAARASREKASLMKSRIKRGK